MLSALCVYWPLAIRTDRHYSIYCTYILRFLLSHLFMPGMRSNFVCITCFCRYWAPQSNQVEYLVAVVAINVFRRCSQQSDENRWKWPRQGNSEHLWYTRTYDTHEWNKRVFGSSPIEGIHVACLLILLLFLQLGLPDCHFGCCSTFDLFLHVLKFVVFAVNSPDFIVCDHWTENTCWTFWSPVRKTGLWARLTARTRYLVDNK